MHFEFATATRIIFGAGLLSEAGAIAAGLGRRALVLTGRTPARAAPLLDALAAESIEALTYSVPGEPTTEIARDATIEAREAHCDVIIGFGGGSVLDTGKAVAILLTNGGAPLDYLEVIGRGQPLTRRAAPYIAIPTTAGTGTEVTRNAVLASPEHRVKVSLRSALMLPRVALVDPELTLTLPPAVTASTGLDAFTQVTEPFISHLANPVTDALCREGVRIYNGDEWCAFLDRRDAVRTRSEPLDGGGVRCTVSGLSGRVALMAPLAHGEGARVTVDGCAVDAPIVTRLGRPHAAVDLEGTGADIPVEVHPLPPG